MPRLVINPGTPQAWEIQLKPGLNFLGRGASNDFKLEDASVSGSHCQITVDNGSAVIKDMGSTNGTYINRAKVTESRLESGQPLRLGSVDMIFYTDGPDAVQSVTIPPPPQQQAPHPAPAPALKPAGLRISGLSHAPAPAPAATATATDAPPMPPDMGTADSAAVSGTRYCKFHPKSPARYLCNKCNRTFCELCVTSRSAGPKMLKMCRSCAVEVVPLQFRAAAEKSFHAKLAASFSYPFKDAGIIIIICATFAFAAMGYARFLGFIFGFGVRVSLIGLIFLFMQNVLHTTTSDEDEPLGFPEIGSLGGPAFQLIATIFASFWPAIGLGIAKGFDLPIPIEAVEAAWVVGGIYFPMAFLAVAMKDSVMAANPLVVLPAIMKAPGKYSLTVLFLAVTFGVYQLGTMLSGGAGDKMLRTSDMGVFFMNMGIKCVMGLVCSYLLVVTMRILGLFYNATKTQLGWFTR